MNLNHYVEKEKLAILVNFTNFFINLPIRNMSLHKSGVQKRKEKRNVMTMIEGDYIQLLR